MPELSLAGIWQASWGDGLHGWTRQFLQPMHDPQRYISMHFPGSIQANLIEAGIIEDPRLGLNSLKARWVEEHFWILRKTFTLPPEAVEGAPVLHIEVLDGVARVALNGVEIGGHWNAHRPAEFDLSGALQPGENELVILLESGLFKVAELPGKDYSFDEAGTLNKRHHLRQAQYQFGWDWNPHLLFFGLHGKIALVWGLEPRLEQVSVLAEVAPDLRSATIRLRPRWFVPGTQPVDLALALKSAPDLTTQASQVLPAGRSETELILEVPSPCLWWPRGYGEPCLYPLHLEARVGGKVIAEWQGQTGLRRVELTEPAHPETGNYFHVKINNQVVFFKGSNWIPPEMSPFEVSPERLERLVDLALEQNFNALRIWGGGVWAGHPLLRLCDEHGLLVWHDLLFACSKYPVDQPEFLKEVETEIAWGLSEFSTHPSLVVWCGNNEMEEGLWSWGYKKFGRTAPDYVLFHQVVPALLRRIDPTRPYWPSSPYSAPDVSPQEPTRGDQHPWTVSLHHENKATDFWMYREFIDRFPNEGGVLGSSPLATLREFLPDDMLKPRSFAWDHHDNYVDYWQPQVGVAYRFVERWLGKPVSDFTLEDYTIASGLLQAEALKEYIRNYRRRFPSTTSAIYWDYVDSWPSIHGWGTLDYYLRRKPSFHAVRRSFAPLMVVLADEKELIGVYIVNETSQPQRLNVEAGTFREASPRQVALGCDCQVEPFNSQRVGRLLRNSDDIYYASVYDLQGNLLTWDRMLLKPFYTWKFVPPQVHISVKETGNGRFAVYQSDCWVWGVLLDPQGELNAQDDAFDLLPGLPYEVALAEGQAALPVKTTGNDLLNQE
jgi:beta-mannosidase